MQLQKTPFALAALALFAGIPFGAHAAPSVSIISPLNGATVSGSDVDCGANASDRRGVSRVQFRLKNTSGLNTSLGTDTASPYTCNFDSSKFSNGSYTFEAIAYDSRGAKSTARSSISIANGTSGGTTTSPTPPTPPAPTNTPPAVSFLKPANNTTVAPGTQVACEVTASDSDGVKQVQWFLDGKLVNTEGLAPYDVCKVSTTGLSGAHVIKAVATDSKGVTGEAQVTINVGSTTPTPTPTPTNTPPAVSFLKPANNTTVAPGTQVACEVTASDSDGVKQVQWFLDGKLVNTEGLAPYDVCKVSTTGLSGAHVIKAVATDSKGAVGEAQVTINVGSTTPTPTPTNTPPAVSFLKPANNATVAPGTQVACEVTATDSDGVKQVQWFLDGKLVNTEGLAPYDVCKVSTTGLSGAHVIKAVATDNKGTVGEAQVTINVGSTTTTNTPPSVGITSPTSGAKLSGTSAGYAASASDPGGSVAKVDMFVGSTLVSTKTAAPYEGTIDTTRFANGTHTLMAVATDNLGASATTQRSVTIENAVSNPDPNPDPGPGTGTTLPSTNAKAVATFESLGIYWKPGSNPGAAGCTVRYRKASESAWKEGLALWYAPADSECRGSIVHLEPGSDYVVEMGLPGQQPSAGLNTRTWSESFPIAQTIHVTNSSQPLNITQGGTAGGYVLYTPAPGTSATIDVANAADYNVKISAPYVIVRGLTLKNARQDGILLTEGAKDVVIEDNDISGWGRRHPQGKLSSEGWQIGENGDSGIAARCGWGSTPWLERSVIQRNKIHHPRYGSNSWSDGHPYGPNAVLFKNCGGNHVFRYNEAYSTTGHYFMDAYGGGTNFSSYGMPNSDSDVYGNILMHAWDDAVEAEGANMNVRIWGNYFDSTATGVATTSTSRGPVYIWRNVQNRSRNKSMATLDGDSRLYTYKSGSADGFGDGRRYVFHNTSLQAPPPAGSTYPLGSGAALAGPGNGQNLTNTVSRNNIFHIWKNWWNAIYNVGSGNDLDYDLTNGGIQAYAGAEANRIVGTPIFEAGHGWQSEAGGMYQLAPSSPGYDRGVRIPNFNDGFTGAAPDTGAHEAGTPAMRLGINGSGSTWASPAGNTSTSSTSTSSTSTGGTTTTTTTTTSDGTSGTTSGGSTSGGGVCSTLVCAAQ